MTVEELHEAVATMTRDSRGRIQPTRLEIFESMNPFDLHTFLMTSAVVREIKTPDQRAWVTDQGAIIVARDGSLTYSDGI